MPVDVLRHLFTGFVRLHVLYHADKEPVCGVDLMEELREHGYEIGPGTLYPMLHDLEEAGFLSSATKIANGKRRKNLRITASGRRLLAQARKQLKELVAEVLDDNGRTLSATRRRTKHEES
jgi:PadR family transcriptional regulator PadR